MGVVVLGSEHDDFLQLKQQSGNVNQTTIDGFLIVPDGGEPQYSSLISQYEHENAFFASYIARAHQILGF
jgi:hypothetical protein